MRNLSYISRRFIINSKTLTFSCIVSICIALILILSMANFSVSINKSYTENLHKEYGDFDMLLTYENYQDIPQEIVNDIKTINGVNKTAQGRTSDQLKIKSNSVYALGVEDNDMMKSRYHYNISLNDNVLVINTVLADILQCKAGDSFKISGVNIQVKEILKNGTLSNTRVAMAIMSLDTLVKLTGESSQANFLMIKAKKGVEINQLSNEILRIDSKLKPNIVEKDPFYKKSIESFTSFIIALILSVVIVVSLFLISIFRGFLYKYHHDMAILRAIGGKPKQIVEIFAYVAIFLSVLAGILGYFITYLMNKTIYSKVFSKMDFIDSKVKFYLLYSLGLTVLIIVIILFVLVFSMLKSAKVLPIVAIQQNEIAKIGKIKTKKQKIKRNNLNQFIKFIDRDLYIAVKMISAKMKENITIILTIMMIIVLSFVGSSLSNIIKANNSNYLKNQYLTDIVVSSSSFLSYSETMQIYENMKNGKDLKVSIVLTNGDKMTIGGQPISYLMADLAAMEGQGIIKNKIQDKNRLIISKELAKKLGVKVGDYIDVITPGKYKYDQNGFRLGFLEKPIKHKLGVSSIVSREKLYYRDAYVDIQLNDFLQDMMGMNCIYISGNLEIANNLLQDLKIKYPNIVWSNYNEMVANSNKAINQRYAMFEVVTGALVVVAGLGWFTSIRSIILSRKREYCILRIQGVSTRRLKKIISIQILLYLFAGIIGGVLIGSAFLFLILYREVKILTLLIDWRLTFVIVLYLLFLCLLLIPLVNKISSGKSVIRDFVKV